MKFTFAFTTAAFAASTQAAAIYTPSAADTSISARDSDNLVSGIPLSTILEVEAGLVKGTLSSKGSAYVQLLNVLGINATYAATLGFHEGESTADVFKTLANLISVQVSVGPSEKRDLPTVPTPSIPVDALKQAIQDLLSGKIGSSAEDFAKLLTILGIDAATAATYKLNQGESVLQYIAQLGQLLASKVLGGVSKRDLPTVPTPSIPVDALKQAIQDLLSGKIGSSAEDFAKLLTILGIDAATAATYKLNQGESVLQYIAQLGQLLASEVLGGVEGLL
ncbi:hypothetical protein KGF57_004757 [Candida theae]|uniref:Opaque-phase-specific protein OP4 n=1 Tax=Candida theae TaxID=1198502 RepID=A0AAD5BBC0_9ASCO|nr:uncharacterized protein KGF57_004757 [Candida theae]KAI5949159.1 hypothetical protein KGF57_004757 [Candida theae]